METGMGVLTLNNRVAKIRQKMAENNIDALLVTHRPNVFYLSGFSGTSGFLLLTAEDALLYTDFRYLQQAGEQAPGFEVVRVNSTADFSAAVQLISQKGLKNIALEEAHISLREFHQFKNSYHGDGRIVPLFNFIEVMRAVKEEEEITKIATAARIADEAFQKILPLLKPGMSELDLAGELEYRLRKSGSEKLPFEIIVASGERSALPHGTAGSRIIKEGEPVTVDFGAVYEGYCSDMTRTFLFGAPSAKQQEIYNMVLQGQEMALSSIKPGQKASAADTLVRNFFQQLGFGMYFGHGLGHGVGLEVHELPTLSPKGEGLLEEAMVFTLEPGIYIEGWGGIRIEDLVVLRSNGVQNLTNTGKRFVIE
ncbi:MAG: aminopeptidase P family protein [Firmicutes bacterium]|jgi:Xaa-Pro aminopeptidase|nr:aminopeptidase P family protein [Bacillota bacterium]